MAVVKPEPVDPVDEELAELLDNPAVRERLDDFERRRSNVFLLGKRVQRNGADLGRSHVPVVRDGATIWLGVVG
jgi:tetrahydromethanopterin S-methyltransferase subunit G